MKRKINIIKDLKQLLVGYFGNNISDVILFGSQISGAATKDSDYDIVIVLNEDYKWQYRDKIYETVFEMEMKLDFHVMFDIHIISKNELVNTLKGAEPIYINALKSGLYA